MTLMSSSVLDTPRAGKVLVTARREFSGANSISRDDLALVAVNGLGIVEIAEPSAHQEFRAAAADRVVAAAAGGRFAIVVFGE
jgi:hypothetical protein